MRARMQEQSKRRGPKKTEVGTQVQVRILKELLEPLDDWIEAQPEPRPTRPEAIRRLVRKSLTKEPSTGGRRES